MPGANAGDFNSAMMELGATVCAPRNPQCVICPVAAACQTRLLGIQEQIPRPKKAKRKPWERRTIYCIARRRESVIEFAFEQRPPTGRWAGMWQFITRPVDAPLKGIDAMNSLPIGRIEHALTHRRYAFDVVRVTGELEQPDCRWLTLAASEALPLPKPHVRVRELLSAVG